MTNVEVKTVKGNYKLKDTNLPEVAELLKLCRVKKQEVIQLIIRRGVSVA